MQPKRSSSLTPTLHRIAYGDAWYAPYLAVREAVLRAPLGLRLSQEEKNEDADPAYVHTAALNGGEIIGGVLCILSPTQGGEMRLRQLAVLEAYQGCGIGRLLVEEAEAIALQAGASGIYLNARVNVQAFYERLGYRTEGDAFEKLGLPHICMRKSLR